MKLYLKIYSVIKSKIMEEIILIEKAQFNKKICAGGGWVGVAVVN